VLLPPSFSCTAVNTNQQDKPGKTVKHENRIFLTQIALPEFNQSLLDFFSLFDSRFILTLLYGSLNLVINALSSGLLGGHPGMLQEKGSRERRSIWTVCCTHNACAPMRCLSERKNVICDAFDSI